MQAGFFAVVLHLNSKQKTFKVNKKMSKGDEFKVTSEILGFFEKDNKSKAQIDEKNVISKFTFTFPGPLSSEEIESDIIQEDEDGDYIVQRKDTEKIAEKIILLEHSVLTEIKLVGLQIWRAALLLADFIIYSQELFKDKIVLELGTGVGLTSIVAGMFAKQIICTDLDIGDILKLIQSNMERNKEIVKAKVFVEELNFFNNDWSVNLNKKIKDVDIVLAADVIYDNDVTEAFVSTMIKILQTSENKTMFMALEKRYVFTLSDLDSVAPCYEHLKSCLEKEKLKPPFSNWTLKKIDIDFPQYFNYERTEQLVLFEIST